MNKPAKIYPEQRTPPCPTYTAQIRAVTVEGWLTYGVPDGLIIKVVIKDGKGLEEEHEEQMAPDDKHARRHAKRFWQAAVMAVVSKV
jgi:hypothetical protein